MNWQDILNDPSLRNLPYKIETEVEILGPEGAREASRLRVFDFAELRL